MGVSFYWLKGVKKTLVCNGFSKSCYLYFIEVLRPTRDNLGFFCQSRLELEIRIGDFFVFEPLCITSVQTYAAISQRLQHPLIEEYTLNHIGDPTIILGIFLN